MKRSLNLLVASSAIGLMMMAMAVPAFAEEPGDPTSHVPDEAHETSCLNQRNALMAAMDAALGIPDPILQGQIDFYDENCPEFPLP